MSQQVIITTDKYKRLDRFQLADAVRVVAAAIEDGFEKVGYSSRGYKFRIDNDYEPGCGQ